MSKTCDWVIDNINESYDTECGEGYDCHICECDGELTWKFCPNCGSEIHSREWTLDDELSDREKDC